MGSPPSASNSITCIEDVVPHFWHCDFMPKSVPESLPILPRPVVRGGHLSLHQSVPHKPHEIGVVNRPRRNWHRCQCVSTVWSSHTPAVNAHGYSRGGSDADRSRGALPNEVPHGLGYSTGDLSNLRSRVSRNGLDQYLPHILGL